MYFFSYSLKGWGMGDGNKRALLGLTIAKKITRVKNEVEKHCKHCCSLRRCNSDLVEGRPKGMKYFWDLKGFHMRGGSWQAASGKSIEGAITASSPVSGEETQKQDSPKTDHWDRAYSIVIYVNWKEEKSMRKVVLAILFDKILFVLSLKTWTLENFAFSFAWCPVQIPVSEPMLMQASWLRKNGRKKQ